MMQVGTLKLKLCLGFAVFLCTLAFLTLNAKAQQRGDLQILIDRLTSLERDFQDLSRVVYRRSELSSAVPREESTLPDSPLADTPTLQRMVANELRMSEIELELRRLTGAVESAIREVELMGGRLDKLVADLDIRLGSVEQELDAVSQKTRDIAVLKNSPGSDESPSAGVSGKQAKIKDTQTLLASSPKALLPEGGAEEQYAYARGLLMKLDYSAAERAFRAFVEINREHQLASNAYYWLGETYYVRQNFADAAGAFIDSYKLFPEGNKAADSLLKLGMSLAILGSKDEACASFEELLLKFADADARLRRRALQEAVRTGCKS